MNGKILDLKYTCEKINIDCMKCNNNEECKAFEEIINDINYLQQKDMGIIPCNWSYDDIELIEESIREN
ncbi:hypothetical protein FKF97_10465 [Clostridium perfringens]|nr:hypothetical protein [Clostridium perfringens]